MKTDLKLDYATHEAAKYACEHWHYSKRMVASIQKPVKFSIYESGIFKGVIVYSCGASSNLGKKYNLKKNECAELSRIALKNHKTEVSKIISISLKLLKKTNPGLRLIISFADKHQNHNGGIYQASNWIYSGESSESNVYISKNGHEFHSRNIGKYTGKDKYGVKKYNINEMVKIEKRPGKHRYLYPFDKEMKDFCLKLSKPYPKRVNSSKVEQPAPPEEGGAVPTLTLHNIDEVE
jgi:hypothetical protein